MQKGQIASYVPTPIEYSSILQVHKSKNSILEDPNLKEPIKVDDKVGGGVMTDVLPAKVLSLKSVKPSLIEMEYGVRGGILDYFKELQKRMKDNPGNYDFTEVLQGNLGNPQAVGGLPITFYRQVLACLIYPPLAFPKAETSFFARASKKVQEQATNAFDSKATQLACVFPSDVCELAQKYLSQFDSLGAYSDSEGMAFCRNAVADFIGQRDGFKCNPETIFLTDGATPAIKLILEVLISSSDDGIMIPVPQYPLYSAAIVRLGGKVIPYYLDEDKGWSLELSELDRAYKQYKRNNPNGCVRCLVVVNPGNPTGALMPHKDLDNMIKFCRERKLVLIADEVYQSLIFDDAVGFKSLRQCLYEQQDTDLEVVSFHTVSKTIGECGIRGGYMQLENFDPEIVKIIAKNLCVSLCANTLGQCLCALMVHPMDPRGPSYAQFIEEYSEMISLLKRKAETAYECFNSVPGITCQRIGGGMYAFPKLALPPKAIKFAQYLKIEPDLLYCAEMLQTLGLLCVPGSAFFQKEGTYHFRTTILPETDAFTKLLQQLKQFHLNFVQHYA